MGEKKTSFSPRRGVHINVSLEPGGGFLRLGPTQRKAELREAAGHILQDSLESLDPATPEASLRHLRSLMIHFSGYGALRQL